MQPYVNNLVKSKDSPRFKSNFLRLNKAAFFASPADGTVVPYETELFGFFERNSETRTVNFKAQQFFQQDLFGLRTLMAQGKVDLLTVQGIAHSQWLKDQTNFVTNVLPFFT